MKLSKWIPMLILLLVVAGTVGMAVHVWHSQHGATQQGKQLYTCPMHPDYISDKPGDCPICNMALVPITQNQQTSAEPSPVPGHATVTISPERRQLIGVQTGRVEKRPVMRRIRATGFVEYNERALATVNLRFGGWVEDLRVRSVGEAVTKGQPLLTVYSQEFREAQRNYRLAQESVEASASLPESVRNFAAAGLRNARERLRFWGATDEQIRELDAKKDWDGRISIVAPADGIVVARNVTLGSSVEAGKDLFQIADLSTVWIIADIYEYEAPLVKVGDEAAITLTALPGEEFKARVGYLYPYLNEKTRTLRVRMEAENPHGRLKPGMWATVDLAADLGEQLVVDDNAILDTGLRQIVYVDLGEGKLEPREVRVGQRAEGTAVILKGLQAGERIVTSGNFLVDSESRLRSPKGGAMAGMPGMPESPAPAAPLPEHHH